MFSTVPVITEAGMTLLLRAAGGEKITFTKFQIGSGSLPSGKDPKTVTALYHAELSDIGISKVEDTEDDGYIMLQGTFDNQSDVQHNFRWTELGLIAKGEDNVEYLYAYANDGDNAGTLKASNSDVVTEQTVSVIVAIGRSGNVTAYILPNATYANRAEFEAHLNDHTNSHHVTKTQVGLSEVPNVSTNDQTPTWTEATSDQLMVSGEKLSESMGKIARGLRRLWGHLTDFSNPHKVTKGQVGLGEVPNVSTNNQTPTYTAAERDLNMTSGEKLNVAMGKLARAVSRLWEHISSDTNPHQTTKAQVGLSEVPNVTTNDQTPTYVAASSDQELISGEKLSVAFGKLARAVTRLWSHIADTDNPHSTGLFHAANISLLNAWGEPDKIGTFVGNGASAATLIVNETSVRGQQINVGFAPSRVAILIPLRSLTPGCNESTMASANILTNMIAGKVLRGIVLIGPNANYYHSSCGDFLLNSEPQNVLSRNHGGAVVYGDGFIVQSYNNSNTDSTMFMNVNRTLYTYLAWK